MAKYKVLLTSLAITAFFEGGFAASPTPNLSQCEVDQIVAQHVRILEEISRGDAEQIVSLEDENAALKAQLALLARQRGEGMPDQVLGGSFPESMLPGQAAIFGMTSSPRATCLHVEVQTDAQLPLEEQLRDEKDENETLRAQFAANAMALTELQAACTAAEINRARQTESLEKVANLEYERDALNKRVLELETLLLQAKQRIGRLEPLSAEVSSLKRALRQSTTENVNAKRDVQLRDDEIRRLKVENTRGKDVAETAKRAHDKLTDSMQSERRAAQTREASLSAEIRRLEAELAAARAKNAEPSRARSVLSAHSGAPQPAGRRDNDSLRPRSVPRYAAPGGTSTLPKVTPPPQGLRSSATPVVPSTVPAAKPVVGVPQTKRDLASKYNF